MGIPQLRVEPDKTLVSLGILQGAVSFQQLLSRLSEILDRAHIAYMLTGSYASSVHGNPRASQDIDIVIAPNRPQLLALLKLLPDTEYYVSDEAALDTLARRSQFNVVDFATGWKVDFIIAKDREFSRTEFERRRLLELDGLTLYFASPEDVLIGGSICRHRASGTSANLASTNRCRSHSIHSFKRF